MNEVLLVVGVIILICVLANRLSERFGAPSLLLFIAVGLLCGVDGIFHFSFENYDLTERVCSISLVFIMFYGGFGTKWSVAKPVAVRSVILSTVGVLATAMLTAAFCIFVLKFSYVEGFLVGAVLSCTDAASVFSILRTRKLSLKDGTASLLEIESGSNDPVSYLLTIIGISLLQGDGQNVCLMFLSQIVIGVFFGVLMAFFAIFILKKCHIVSEGMDAIFIIAVVIISYALPILFNGNGYLSVYLTGIILGNSKIGNKTVLVHFFDSVTNFAQILIFFLLGLLATPHMMVPMAGTAVLVAAFLLFVARPVAVFLLLKPFKASTRQCMLVSFAGLRGASSIVFAILVIASGVTLEHDIFHIVFLVALLSVGVQGSLLPLVSKKLDMIDEESDVRKTFNDYQDEETMTLMRMYIPVGHNWVNKMIQDVTMPTGALALMIKRNGETIIPRGDTVILAEDNLILNVPAYRGKSDIELEEIEIDRRHKWCGKSIRDLNLPENVLIAVIKRGDENIIPSGKTMIQERDVVVIYN